MKPPYRPEATRTPFVAATAAGWCAPALLWLPVALIAPLVIAPHRATAGDTSEVIAEVIVTARKREERLIDTPVTVQAVSAETLESNRIETVNDLYGSIPSLYLSSNLLSPGKDFLNLAIRGVGAQTAGSPAVATFVDGVYSPALGFDIEFLDLERIEVLKGPQGTLFGRNTEGGALNVVVRRPDQTRRGRFSLAYDEFNTLAAKLAVSGPLAPTLAASLGIDVSSTDGYLDNPVISSAADPGSVTQAEPVDANDSRKVAARVAFAWHPADRASVHLTLDHSNRKGHDGLPGVPIGDLPGGRGHPFAVHEGYDAFSEFQLDSVYRNAGTALTIDYDLGDVQLTSITGYRKLSSMLPFDFDGGTDRQGNFHDLRQSQRFFSEELRALGNAFDGRLKWLAGAFAFHERDFEDRRYSLPTIPILPGITIRAQDQHLTLKGFAAFSELTWGAAEHLELSGGLRYSRDKVRSDLDLDFFIPNLLGPGIPFAVDESGSDELTFADVSPTFTALYRLSGHANLYARYARGYKSGGFPKAPASISTNIPFEEETSQNYELGFKAALLEERVRFDVALYEIDLENQQLSSIVFLNGDPNLPVAAVANAGKSRSRGAEASFTLRPATSLVLRGDVGYVDAEYREYVDTTGQDRSGERFPFTPQWTGSVAADYSWQAFNDWAVTAGTTYRYVSDILSGTGVDIDLQFPVPSYHRIDLRLGFERGPWTIDCFADNVTNEYIVTRIWNTFFFPDPPARPHAVVEAPRRVGVRVTHRF